MLYQGILLCTAVLAAVHAGSYAHSLWQKHARHQAVVIYGMCLAALMMAGGLILSS